MERYPQKTVLGNTGFGKTYLAAEKTTNEERALKVIDISSSNASEFDVNSLAIQVAKNWNHPNLVLFLECFAEGETQQCAVISEYCPSKVLFH